MKMVMLSVFVKSIGNISGQHMYFVYLITITVEKIAVMVHIQCSI